MICSHFVIHWKLVIIIIKTAKNEHSNDYHYYFKVTIGFQCLTTIRQYAMGSKGLGGHARIREGGGGRGSGPHRKISRYMGRSRSKPPPAPDEISWFHAWGGGGNLFHWNALEQIA